jgi:hypothetical protein
MTQSADAEKSYRRGADSAGNVHFHSTMTSTVGARIGQPCFPKGTIVTSTIQWLRLLLCVSRYHLLSVLSPQESCDLQARPLGHALTVLLAQPWQLEVIPTKSTKSTPIGPDEQEGRR